MIPPKQSLSALLAAGLVVIGLSELSLSESSGINILIVNQGEVKIKKENWKSFQKASTGSLLRPNDYLKVGATASATLLCSNTKKWQPTPGKEFKVSEGCPRGEASRPRRIAPLRPTRAGGDPIPYILSPRNTDILNPRPLLKWNAVPGTSFYRVQVEGSGLNWQTQTREAQVVYGGESLKPGSRYLVTVKTDKDVSSERETGNLRFGLLPTGKAKVVEGEMAVIKGQGLSTEGEALALAYLYEGYNLKAEAIYLLQPLVQRKSENRVVYALLGDLYLQTELPKEAQAAYQQALTLAQKGGDKEGEAEAQTGLGEANFGLGKKDEAIGWLKQAQGSYQALGDEVQVQVLASRIEEIQKKPSKT